MNDFIAVMPAIAADLARTSIATMGARLRDQLVLIDNTPTGTIDVEIGRQVGMSWTVGRNLGVPESWNFGVRAARANRARYLLIVSQSIRFGPPGGDDFLDELEERQPAHVLHSQHGWKFLAVNLNVFAQVGLFDPIFWPAYYEDSDMLVRMHLGGMPSPQYNGGRFDQIVAQSESAGDGIMLSRRTVMLDYKAHHAKFVAKWGCDPAGGEPYTHPYDDPSLPISFTGVPPSSGNGIVAEEAV